MLYCSFLSPACIELRKIPGNVVGGTVQKYKIVEQMLICRSLNLIFKLQVVLSTLFSIKSCTEIQQLAQLCTTTVCTGTIVSLQYTAVYA